MFLINRGIEKLGAADIKIEEAQYFLAKIANHDGSSKEFMFNLSAFLTAARSVVDVLLYEYGIEYGLFTIDDRIGLRDFERLARGVGGEAERFYNWISAQIAALETDPIAGFLSTKRHILVHRGLPAMVWSLTFYDSISFSSSFVTNQPEPPAGSATPNAMDVMTVPVCAGSAAQQPQTYVIPRATQLQGYFADNTHETVVNLCGQYVKILEAVVLAARGNFP